MTVLWGRAVAVTGTAARRCSLAGAVPRCVLSPRRPQQQQKGRQRRLAWCCTETPTSGNGQERRRRRNRYSDSVSSDSRSDPKGQQQQQLLLAPPQSGRRRRRRRREESGSGWTVSDEAAGYGRPEAESMWGAGQEFDEATERRIERVSLLTMTAALLTVATVTERTPSIALVGLVLFITPVTRRYVQNYIASFVRVRHRRWREEQGYDQDVNYGYDRAGEKRPFNGGYEGEWSYMEPVETEEEGRTNKEAYYLPSASRGVDESPTSPGMPSGGDDSQRGRPLRSPTPPSGPPPSSSANRRMASRRPPTRRANRTVERSQRNVRREDDSGILGLKWESSLNEAPTSRRRSFNQSTPALTSRSRQQFREYDSWPQSSITRRPSAGPDRPPISRVENRTKKPGELSKYGGEKQQGKRSQRRSAQELRDEWLGPANPDTVSRGWGTQSDLDRRQRSNWVNSGESYGESGNLERYVPPSDGTSMRNARESSNRSGGLLVRIVVGLIPGLRKWGGLL